MKGAGNAGSQYLSIEQRSKWVSLQLVMGNK